MKRFVAVLVVLTATLVPSPSGAAVANRYVALGDSYTAAPLVPEPVGDPYDCGRSTQNYPHVVARWVHATSFTDVSCGSAETEHMTKPQDGLPLGGTNPPQFNALDANVGLVTIGISGNDVGFGSTTTTCVQPPEALGGESCKAALTAGGHDRVSEAIKKAAPLVAAVLKGIHQRSPMATVVLVGYPDLMPEHSDAGCYPYVPILPVDVAWVRAKNKELNAMLAAQAKKGHALYADWYTPTIGHDMCQIPTKAWTNAVVVVPLSYPAHPNLFGERAAAHAVVHVLHAAHFTLPR